MIVDQKEREEALDPSRSFIVQAPAGSGKTGLLVHRYLKLLSSVEKPESVVAMTFTRKAAGELKDRIHDALVAAAADLPDTDEHALRTRALARAVLKQDQRYGWNLLLDSSRLQLQTIDSLCALLARQMPVVSGFSSSAQVVEDATELYREAASETFRQLSEGPAELRSLLTRLGIYFDSDFDCLSGQIVRMLAQRDQWRFSEDDVSPEACDFLLLLNAAERALATVFRERRAVDFTAITQAAIEVLGSPEQPSDVLYGLDYRIQHLLVDEFQDTSLAQYKLLEALTAQWSDGDGRTLFLVGDPMQSIYRFRGAEVALFLKTWNDERLQSVRLHRLALQTNFRSTPEILQWIDQQFEPMMSSGSRTEVEFRPAQASREPAAAAPEWHALIADDGEEEAATVARLAKRAQARGSVAILVRNRNHLAKILPALRQAEIDYEAVEIDQLGERQYILDLLSLTHAVLHIGNRTAWLACLRAPWCGLSLDDLSALAENERDKTILDLLNDPAKIAALSPEARERAIRTGEILSAAVAQAGRTPLRSLVENTWLLLGGPAILRETYQTSDVNVFFLLLEALESGGTISDFTQLNTRLSCLFAKGAPDPNSVQVMTIFKAKGLEFDTVILPKLEGITQTPERDLLIWEDAIAGDGSSILQVAAQPRRGEESQAYREIRDAQKYKNEQELKRLLYVACTRAKNALYLVGNAKLKKDKTLEQPRSGSFLRLLWPAAQSEFQGIVRRSARQMELPFKAEPQTALRRVPASWKLPRFSRWIRWQPPFEVMTPSTRKVTYEWVSDTGRHIGTVVHELLKRAAENSALWDSGHVLAMAPTIKSELLRLGVPRADEPDASERVIRALLNTLSSERGRWILSAHAEARSEWPVGGKLDDRLISGTIDRVFRDEGNLWIIDFKTSEHEGAQRDKFLAEEERRYRPQLESYAALIAQLSKGPIWLGLYFPLLDAWREWQYEESATLIATYTE